MVMRAMRAGTSGGFFKYLLFGLLGMSVGGLVVMDVRGVLGGGGVGGNDVARIEDETISIQKFDRSLRRTLAQYRGVTPQQAFKIGLTEEILTGEIRAYFLLQEAKDMGLVLDKNRLAQHVAEALKPNARPGQTLQAVLENVLRQQGMSENEFVETMNRESSGNIIMEALRLGFKPDSTMMAHDLYQFQKQERDVDLIIFPDDEISNIEPATEEQLKRLYDAVKVTQYKVAEFRTVQAAFFDPKVIEIKVDVSEEEAKKYYEANIKEFGVGEQLLLTQSLVDNPEQAQQIYEANQSGKSLKDSVLEVTGSTDKYFENRSFETEAMFPDILDALEKIDVGGVTPPIKTLMGHHIVRLDKILPPSTRPYEEVKNSIIQKIISEKKDERIYKISEDLDEMLNDGLALEEIQKSIKIQISTIGPVDKNGFGKSNEKVMEMFDRGDQKNVADLIFELQKGEPSLLQELSNGQLVAFVISEIEEEHFTPFDQVKDELAAQYIRDQKHAENEMVVKKHLAEIGTGGSVFEGIARDNNKKIEKIKAIKLSGDIQAPLTDNNRPDIFQTAIGDYGVLEFNNQFALMKVSGFKVPDITDEAKEEINEIQKTVDREAGDEMFLMYIRKIADKYKIQVNRKLLERAYGEKEDERY